MTQLKHGAQNTRNDQMGSETFRTTFPFPSFHGTHSGTLCQLQFAPHVPLLIYSNQQFDDPIFSTLEFH